MLGPYSLWCDDLALGMQGDLLEQMLKVVTRKFSGSAKAWLAHIRHCIGRSEVEASQKLLERSLSSLPQDKHIKVTHLQCFPHEGRDAVVAFACTIGVDGTF